MSRLTSIARDELKERVLFEACDLLAAGLVPSAPHLASRLPGSNGTVLVTLRDELRAEGRLIYEPPKCGVSPLAARHAAARDRAQREQRIKTLCRIRATKMAAGEPTWSPGLTLRQILLYHMPCWDPRGANE